MWARRSDNILLGWPGATGGATGFSLGQSPFTISATQPTTPSNPTPGRPDMSGDTLADMVVQTTDGTLSIRRKQTSGPYFDTGTQVSWGWQDYFGLAGQGALYFADIDGDGAKDLISLGTDGTITVRKNNGNGTAFDTGTLTSAHWSNYLGQAGQGKLYFADITGDGKSDLVVLDTAGTVSYRINIGTFFDAGRAASANWSNFLGGAGKGLLYFS